jgi:putative IMPACT (imprinted ancient) family translation regulator
VVVTITRADGSRDSVLFRCQVDASFLQQVSALLKKARSGREGAKA